MREELRDLAVSVVLFCFVQVSACTGEYKCTVLRDGVWNVMGPVTATAMGTGG